MTTAVQDVISLLGAASTNAGTRIYTPSDAPPPTAPFVMVALAINTPSYTFAAQAPIDNVRVQVDSYAATRSAASALSLQVRAAMEGATLKSVMVSGADSPEYDDVIQLYRASCDFSVWHTN